MKKLFILLVACVLSCATAANATTWRINPSPFAKAQFKTVAEAMADINVSAGDILLLDPGTHEQCDVTARKNITVIGSGYFLDKNKQWAESQSTVLSSARIGSGSKIEGCDVTSSIILLGDATASRCKVKEVVSSGENNLVTQCYCLSSISLSNNSIARNNMVFWTVTSCCKVTNFFWKLLHFGIT